MAKQAILRRAVVLFAHGARDPEWARPFRQLVAELGELLPGERVVLAFLELMQPALPECAAALHGDGFRSLRVVPVFLGAGGHLKNDLPALVAGIRERYEDLEITVEPPIGEQPGVIAAIAAAIAR
ncbi:MAG TPA: CbiX/SirB N-terminal domain-containing protein [Burkholderiales bacterium]|nr:CbiX/SirB N-terminal domain-containing protein [Burkholderiales bacterium]